MLICSGSPSTHAVSAALRNGPVRNVDPKIIGRSYQIPPWEITGVRAAGSIHGSHYQATAPVIGIDRRNFALYPRNGTTVLIQRRR